MTFAGIVGGSSAEPDRDLVAELRDRFNAATDALDDCDRAARMERGRKPSLLLYRVVCVDEDTTLWPACDLVNCASRSTRWCGRLGCEIEIRAEDNAQDSQMPAPTR